MVVKTFTVLTTDQEGKGTNAADYTGGAFNDEIAQYRYILARFAAVDIPQNSTITSATIEIDIDAKNPGDTGQYVQCDLYYHNSIPSPPLISGENVASRSYSYTLTSAGAANSNRTFNWNTAGLSKQIFSFDVKNTIATITSNASWPASGYGAITIAMYCTAENGYLSANYKNNNAPIRLIVDYTPPATTNLYIPNLLEFGNCQFPGTTVTNYQWESNNVFGSFATATLDRYTVNTGGPTATPDGIGSYTLRALAPTTGKTFINYKAMELEVGVWHTFSVYVWVPTGAPDWRMESLFRQNTSLVPLVTTKNAWVRGSVQILGRGRGTGLSFGITTGAAATGASQYLYLSHAMLTKTNYLTPYWSGNTTAGTGRTYGFVSGVSGSGIAVMTTKLPTATITSTMPDVSKSKVAPATTFTYSDPNAVAQGAFEIQTRRVS